MLAKVGHQIEHTRHFLAAHPTRGAIGPLGRIDEIPVGIIFARIAVAHLHHHQEQDSQQADADQDAVYPMLFPVHSVMFWSNPSPKKVLRLEA